MNKGLSNDLHITGTFNKIKKNYVKKKKKKKKVTLMFLK